MAGYKAWQKNFERHVNKGEKAIRILAPAPYKIKEERDKIDPVTQEIMLDRDGNPQKEEVEITIPAFRAVSVFDVSQTDEKPIPELEAKELLSDAPENKQPTSAQCVRGLFYASQPNTLTLVMTGWFTSAMKPSAPVTCTLAAIWSTMSMPLTT